MDVPTGSRVYTNRTIYNTVDGRENYYLNIKNGLEIDYIGDPPYTKDNVITRLDGTMWSHISRFSYFSYYNNDKDDHYFSHGKSEYAQKYRSKSPGAAMRFSNTQSGTNACLVVQQGSNSFSIIATTDIYGGQEIIVFTGGTVIPAVLLTGVETAAEKRGREKRSPENIESSKKQKGEQGSPFSIGKASILSGNVRSPKSKVESNESQIESRMKPNITKSPDKGPTANRDKSGILDEVMDDIIETGEMDVGNYQTKETYSTTKNPSNIKIGLPEPLPTQEQKWKKQLLDNLIAKNDRAYPNLPNDKRERLRQKIIVQVNEAWDQRLERKRREKEETEKGVSELPRAMSNVRINEEPTPRGVTEEYMRAKIDRAEQRSKETWKKESFSVLMREAEQKNPNMNNKERKHAEELIKDIIDKEWNERIEERLRKIERQQEEMERKKSKLPMFLTELNQEEEKQSTRRKLELDEATTGAEIFDILKRQDEEMEEQEEENLVEDLPQESEVFEGFQPPYTIADISNKPTITQTEAQIVVPANSLTPSQKLPEENDIFDQYLNFEEKEDTSEELLVRPRKSPVREKNSSEEELIPLAQPFNDREGIWEANLEKLGLKSSDPLEDPKDDKEKEEVTEVPMTVKPLDISTQESLRRRADAVTIDLTAPTGGLDEKKMTQGKKSRFNQVKQKRKIESKAVDLTTNLVKVSVLGGTIAIARPIQVSKQATLTEMNFLKPVENIEEDIKETVETREEEVNRSLRSIQYQKTPKKISPPSKKTNVVSKKKQPVIKNASKTKKGKEEVEEEEEMLPTPIEEQSIEQQIDNLILETFPRRNQPMEEEEEEENLVVREGLLDDTLKQEVQERKSEANIIKMLRDNQDTPMTSRLRSRDRRKMTIADGTKTRHNLKTRLKAVNEDPKVAGVKVAISFRELENSRRALICRIQDESMKETGGTGSYVTLMYSSIEKILITLVQKFNMGPKSRFVDLGSGYGHITFQAALTLELEAAHGIERGLHGTTYIQTIGEEEFKIMPVDKITYYVSILTKDAIVRNVPDLRKDMEKVMFYFADVKNVAIKDYTHIISFNTLWDAEDFVGFIPRLLADNSRMEVFGSTKDLLNLKPRISDSGDQKKLDQQLKVIALMKAKLIEAAKVTVKSPGRGSSGAQFTMYFYIRRSHRHKYPWLTDKTLDYNKQSAEIVKQTKDQDVFLTSDNFTKERKEGIINVKKGLIQHTIRMSEHSEEEEIEIEEGEGEGEETTQEQSDEENSGNASTGEENEEGEGEGEEEGEEENEPTQARATLARVMETSKSQRHRSYSFSRSRHVTEERECSIM